MFFYLFFFALFFFFLFFFSQQLLTGRINNRGLLNELTNHNAGWQPNSVGRPRRIHDRATCYLSIRLSWCLCWLFHLVSARGVVLPVPFCYFL
jgi:hypothetical protein